MNKEEVKDKPEESNNMALITSDGKTVIVTKEEWDEYSETGKLPDRELTEL